MKRTTVHLVAGARPNFMKLAPIVRELEKHPDSFVPKIVHTGQHYASGMSGVFFDELGIPEPAYHLAAGSGTHAEQTARIMIAFEKICMEERPDLVMVVGDVNSTLACSIVARKLCIPVAHVEAGLRRHDMPEEINRIVTDSISDYFFVTEPSGVTNLKREGKPEDRMFYVGYIMVDNLLFQAAKIEKLDTNRFEKTSICKQRHPRYGVVTLHRPSNVDDPAALARVMSALKRISKDLPLFFPAHPRTQNNLARFGSKLASASN